MSSERRFLESSLRRLTWTLRWRRAIETAGRGWLVASVLVLGLALVTRLFPALPTLPLLASILLGLLFVAFFWGALRPVPLRAAAIAADRAAGTQEVISTAYELSTTDFDSVNLSRACTLLHSIPRRKFKPTIAPHLSWPPFLMVSIALAIVAFVPSIRWDKAADETAHLPALRAHRLEQEARQIKKLADETEDARLQRIHHQMQRLIQQMRDGKLSKKEALAKLSELSMFLLSLGETQSRGAARIG